MKELKEAIKTLWEYIVNIPRSPLRICLWIVCILEQWQTKSSLSVSIGAS